MCIRDSIYVCMCERACAYVCVHVCVYMCVCLCIYLSVCLYIYLYIFFLCACMRMCVLVYAHVCVYVYICLCVCMYIVYSWFAFTNFYFSVTDFLTGFFSFFFPWFRTRYSPSVWLPYSRIQLCYNGWVRTWLRRRITFVFPLTITFMTKVNFAEIEHPPFCVRLFSCLNDHSTTNYELL